MLQRIQRQGMTAAAWREQAWEDERSAVDAWIQRTVVAIVDGYRIRSVPGSYPARFVLEGTGLVFASVAWASLVAASRPIHTTKENPDHG